MVSNLSTLKMKIQNKLFSIFMAFGTLLVIAVVGLVQWSIDRGAVEYVNQKEIDALRPFMSVLIESYREQGNWGHFSLSGREFDRLLRQTLVGTEFKAPRPERGHRIGPRPPPSREYNRPRKNDRHLTTARAQDGELRRPFSSKDTEQNHRPPPRREYQVSYALLDANKEYIVGNYPRDRDYSNTPLIVDNMVVGYMAISKRHRLTQGYEFDFVEQQKGNLWYIAFGVMLIVALITLPFAKHLLEPIRALTKGMHLLTQGKYKSKLTTNRKDEFSDLARDFNELAKTLLENDAARKRWLANISHELRTPIAILKGELEAILDGVRSLSIDQIQSAHQEVSHLQRLISDLHALTSADIGGMSYRKNTLNIVTFIKQEINKLQGYLATENLKLECHLVSDNQELLVFADETRLCQLLENLMNNCIKYAKTGSLVKLTLSTDNLDKMVNIVIEDDGVGVEAQHLPRLFEHLYRADNSRNRKTGGSGLGLSICAHIVHAHLGNISAQKSELGGLAIHINLPLQ